LGASVAQAQPYEPPTAKSLPEIDLSCYQSYLVGFNETFSGLSVDGDNLGLARYRIVSIQGRTLKIIQDPERPENRKEWGKAASEISISAIADPARRPPIFTWKEVTTASTTVFSLHASDKLLSIVEVLNPGIRSLNKIYVLKCK